MRTATESFLLLSPDIRKSSHEVARRLIACKGVRKVTITSGDVGFVVSTLETGGDHCSEKISRSVNRLLGRRKARIAKGHYVYTKTA